MRLLEISKQFINSKTNTKIQVIEQFSLDLPERGIVAFMGASGCGKTTLFNIIAGILPPDSGIVETVEPCSFVFQEDRLLPWINAIENIEIVMDKNQHHLKMGSKLLEEMGLSGIESQTIQELSGGMRRRIAIIRALAYDAPLVLMDEPFKGLDDDIKKIVMEVVRRNNRDKLTLFITHDINEAKYLSDEIYLLDGPPLKIVKQIK